MLKCTFYIFKGQCVCKKNVLGIECNECKPGYFNLQENNPSGCTGWYTVYYTLMDE